LQALTANVAIQQDQGIYIDVKTADPNTEYSINTQRGLNQIESAGINKQELF